MALSQFPPWGVSSNLYRRDEAHYYSILMSVNQAGIDCSYVLGRLFTKSGWLPPRLTSFRIISSESRCSGNKISGIFGTKTLFLAIFGPF